MEKILDNIKDCTGCFACIRSCNYQAIEKENDDLGFVYPKITLNNCITCHKCQDRCPVYRDNLIKQNILNNETTIAYTLKHNDRQVVRASSAGGMFTQLSDYVLENNGLVYGVVLDENLEVVYQRADTKEVRDLMRGAKYVEADISNMYSLIMKDLIRGHLVLFTGTPCQCAGIKSIFKGTRYYPNLIILDFVCHGVSSPLFYQDFKVMIERQHKGKLQGINFTSKQRDYDSTQAMDYTINNQVISDDTFNLLYKKHSLILRDSCYECPFTSLSRCSDLTLAQAYGVEHYDAHSYDKNGVSTLLVNTDKGMDLFDKIKDFVTYKDVDLKHILNNQEHLSNPPSKPNNYNELMTYYQEHSLEDLINKLSE